jgi:hypothetical protein
MPGLGASIPLLGSVAGSSVPVVPQTAELTEQIGVTYGLIDVRARPVTVTDEIDVSEALNVFYGMVVVERVRLALAQTANFAYQLTATDVAHIADRLYPAVPAALADGIGLELAQQAQQAITVLEGLGLQPALAPMMLYGRSIEDTIRVAGVLGRFFGGDISEGIGIAPVLSGYASKGVVLTETIGLAENVTPQLILRVTAADTVGIDADDALQLVFNGTISDGIEIAAGYVAPNGSFTTWAINTRTGATTEYSNYAFNSFAKLGDVYLGASTDGLYTLTGDDDDGADIIAQIKSGFAQWAGTKLTGFKGAYLAVRGGGDYVLKLETGDGSTYTYAVSAKDMATTKITLGKGLRARYFAFELISTGQDFDLDTLEFVPLVSERRV